MPDPRRIDEFIRLFSRNEPRIAALVASLVPNQADADEVLQESNLVLWKKFDEYQTGSNFLAWACRVVEYQVLHFRRTKGRERLTFGDDFVVAVARETVAMSDELGARQAALRQCIQRLPDDDRQLLRHRYTDGATTRHIAELAGKSVDTVYKSLQRVRRRLMSCIERTMTSESWA
jgi:RNA polymerase sigma-70 factor (ECF subfamily)